MLSQCASKVTGNETVRKDGQWERTGAYLHDADALASLKALQILQWDLSGSGVFYTRQPFSPTSGWLLVLFVSEEKEHQALASQSQNKLTGTDNVHW